jgi:hypothetical protein
LRQVGVVVAPSSSDGGRKQKKSWGIARSDSLPKLELDVVERVGFEEKAACVADFFSSLSHVVSWAHMLDVLQDAGSTSAGERSMKVGR